MICACQRCVTHVCVNDEYANDVWFYEVNWVYLWMMTNDVITVYFIIHVSQKIFE